MAFEKYQTGKGADSALRERQANSPQVLETRKSQLQEQLQNFREKQRLAHEKRRLLVIEKARSETIRSEKVQTSSSLDFEKDDLENQNVLRHERHLEEYDKILKEKGGDGIQDYVYSELSEWQFNQEAFRGDKGWLKEFEKNEDPNISLEEFVLKKQYEQLDKNRQDLMEVRLNQLFPELYPVESSDSDAKKEDDKKKLADISSSSKSFFSQNNDQIEQLLMGNVEDGEKVKKVMLNQYLAQVFVANGLDPLKAVEGSQEYQKISLLFQSLLDDYAAMLVQREVLKENNPLMVQMMLNGGVSEEEWLDKLNKHAKEKAEKMAKEKENEKKVPLTVTTPYVGNVSQVFYGDNSVSSAEKLGSDSLITFEAIGPGKYEIKYPSPRDAGEEVSYLSVRTVVEDGVEKRIYVFRDKVIDHPTMVDDRDFRREVNCRYLDHAMNALREGEDYFGPKLNEVLHDQEMMELADQLFYPKSLREMVLSLKDVNAFKTLMKVLTNPSNNLLKDGPYGDLRAVRNRIGLLKLTMGVEGGVRSPQLLSLFTNPPFAAERFNTLSVQDLCQMVGMPANGGNFEKK